MVDGFIVAYFAVVVKGAVRGEVKQNGRNIPAVSVLFYFMVALTEKDFDHVTLPSAVLL